MSEVEKRSCCSITTLFVAKLKTWIKAIYALIVKDFESLSTSSNQSDSSGCCVCFHVCLSQSRPWGSMVNPTWSTFTGWTRTTTVSNCRWGSRLSRSRASSYPPTAPTTGEHYRSERYSYQFLWSSRFQKQNWKGVEECIPLPRHVLYSFYPSFIHVSWKSVQWICVILLNKPTNKQTNGSTHIFLDSPWIKNNFCPLYVQKKMPPSQTI